MSLQAPGRLADFEEMPFMAQCSECGGEEFKVVLQGVGDGDATIVGVKCSVCADVVGFQQARMN